MAIEVILERIAVALEAIADSKKGVVQTSEDSLPRAKPVQAELTRPGRKTETQKSELAEEAAAAKASKGKVEITEVTGTTEDDFLPDDEGEDPGDIKWPDVNKKLFDMLEKVRDVESREAAKKLCGELMKKYSGGQKFGPGTVAPKSYKALLADIEAQSEALNG